MNVLFTSQREGTRFLKDGKNRPSYYGLVLVAEGHGCPLSPPCQATVNKAQAELESGNEFLIGDTLYLSS